MPVVACRGGLSLTAATRLSHCFFLYAYKIFAGSIASSSCNSKPKDSNQQEKLTHLYNETALRYGIVFDELIRQVAVHSMDLATLVGKVGYARGTSGLILVRLGQHIPRRISSTFEASSTESSFRR